jgi:hypothetical protein
VQRVGSQFETAISRIFSQLRELKTHFGIARDKETCCPAQILYDMYNYDSNYAYLLKKSVPFLPLLKKYIHLDIRASSSDVSHPSHGTSASQED